MLISYTFDHCGPFDIGIWPAPRIVSFVVVSEFDYSFNLLQYFNFLLINVFLIRHYFAKKTKLMSQNRYKKVKIVNWSQKKYIIIIMIYVLVICFVTSMFLSILKITIIHTDFIYEFKFKMYFYIIYRYFLQMKILTMNGLYLLVSHCTNC